MAEMVDETLMDEGELGRVVKRLTEMRQAEAMRLDPIHSAVNNRLNDLYVPRSATSEYKRLVEQSKFNVLPLVVTQLAQALYVDGYRSSGAVENSAIWDAVWQPNRMDARQGGLYRSAIQYGLSYALVLPDRNPAKPPVITPMSPRRCTAMYHDPLQDEWAELALVHERGRKWSVYEAGNERENRGAVRYHLLMGEEAGTIEKFLGAEKYPFSVLPLVRFLDSYDDLDNGPQGKVQPLIPVQKQLNQTTYGLLMAQQYAAFRQRWATGMAIAEDPNGTPIEPFNAAVNRVWANESPDAKFGEFGQTDLGGYLESRDKTLLYVASVCQIPPHNLVVGNAVSNISAEALAALEAGHRQDVAEHQTSFGESVEQMLRLAALEMGDMETWEDTSAQVRWRDTTPRSLAQVADALGKLAQLLDVPSRALWEMIPGVTDTDIARWESLAGYGDALSQLAQLMGPAETPETPERAPVITGAQ